MTKLKRMGKEDLWLAYSGGGGYTDSEIIGKYRVDTNEDDDTIRIRILNPDRPCVVMAISKKGFGTGLDVVKYDARCTIDGKIKRGSGTKEMLEFAFDILRRRGVDEVSLSDESVVYCDDLGKDIDLGGMSFLKSGKTWYEKHFGFQPAKRFQESYTKAKQTRKEKLDIEMIEKQPCSYFTEDKIYDLFHEIGLRNFQGYEWVKKL